MRDIESVYRQYFGDVFRFLSGLCGDAGLAEELTAETFFRALNAIGSFRGDCDIRVWLCQIAKNLYYTHQKRAKRTTPLRSDAPAPPMDAALYDRSEAREIAEKADALPEPYRTVFALRVYDALDFETIGECFHKSANWACVVYHRAKKCVREGLDL